MIRNYAILISALYAVAAVLWMLAHMANLQTQSRRAFRLAEFVGKSSAYFAMGLTVALLLALLFRSIGWFPSR